MNAPPRLAPAKEAAPPPSRGRIWLWLALSLLGLVGLGLLYQYPPDQHSFYPRCLLHVSTGWQCPGCGGLRAAHELLHGRLASAFYFNPLLVLGLPLAALWTGLHFWAVRHGRPRLMFLHQTGWLWLLVAVFLLYGILRNIPLGK